jgi:CRISPR/Cas system CSM-associated protein Csm3 (group 7 of RAMP superfamily)
MSVNKLEGRIIAMEPISHIGESRSIDSLFNREAMLITTKTGITKRIDVPIISGNSLRGILRRKGGFRLLELLGLNKEDLTEGLQHAIFSGGTLHKGADGGVLDTQFISKIRQNLPVISLFGSVIGNQMVGSKMDVGQLVPISCQTKSRTGIESEVSIYSLLDERPATRRDDIEDKTKGSQDPDEQKQQMRYTHEVLVAGTEFYHYFTLKNCNQIEEGTFWSTLAEFNKYPKIGGLGCRGFGLIKLNYVIQDDLVQLYEKWVVDNQQTILKYIKEIEAIA